MVLKDEVVLITGASSGIGRATAEAMAREGARVAVNYCHNQAGAEEVVAATHRLGQEAFAIRADVTRSAEVGAMVKAVRERWGRIDALVNNAGDLIKRTPLAEMTEEYWDQIMALNLKSAFLCVKAVWKEMAERKSGGIINVSSVAARNGGGLGASAYAAAKGGLLTYTKSLAKELAPFGINVNCVSPGPMDTEMTLSFPREQMIQSIPLKKFGEPQDVADVVLFLASQQSKYITGETINVNGGLFMG